MIRLSKEQILMLHSQLIEQTGGSDGVRDYNLLDSVWRVLFNHLEGMNYIRPFKQKQQD